ncbi:MAG: sugar phosphate isomerase/epimerase [Acidobacteriota bacterium]|nr:sugar phosphate isomerase/epimerase [Acidobacteriota bacterium]
MLTRRSLIRSLPGITAASWLALKSGAATALPLINFPAGAEQAGASGPHFNFPSEARQRIAVASWPFRAYIDSPTNSERDPRVRGMDLKDFASNVVAKFNVHNIEPYNQHFHSINDDYLDALREALASAKVHAVNIAVDIEPSFYDADRVVRRKAVNYAKQWVDVAARIGSPGIRTSNSQSGKSSPSLPLVVESLKEVASYGESKNVVVNLENDNLVSEDAFFVVKVIEAVNSPYLHALPDFGNSMMSGNASFNYRAVEAMFQHAFGICHVKDGETNAQGKRVDIDLQRTFNILKSSGYRGYCSIEYDGAGDPYAATQDLIERSVRYLG